MAGKGVAWGKILLISAIIGILGGITIFISQGSHIDNALDPRLNNIS